MRRWLIALISALTAGLIVGLGGAVASPPDTLALVTLQPLASRLDAQALITSAGGRLSASLNLAHR